MRYRAGGANRRAGRTDPARCRSQVMQLLNCWLRDRSVTERVLDLGCGTGSLGSELAGLQVIAVDNDPGSLAKNPSDWRVRSESNQLPFSDESFSLVICHHSLEHFSDIEGAIDEIRRVLKPAGRLFVTVPDGMSFTDRLYRLLFCGGGHIQRFTFDGAVWAIEAGTELHLVAWQELFSSFIFVDKTNFLPGRRDGQSRSALPRRMRWLGRLPGWCFGVARILLNAGTRLLDRCLDTHLSRYGWVLAFAPEVTPLKIEQGTPNVCMSCGSGIDNLPRRRFIYRLYRCPVCSSWNIAF